MTIHVEQTVGGPADTGDLFGIVAAALLVSAMAMVALVPAKPKKF
jgi:hypothetical protein